jgi:cytochrome P450
MSLFEVLRRSRQQPAGDDMVNITSATFKANPYPFYTRLRAQAPVFRVTLPDRLFAWLVTRYDDVSRVLKDEGLAKDRRNAMTVTGRFKTALPEWHEDRLQLQAAPTFRTSKDARSYNQWVALPTILRRKVLNPCSSRCSPPSNWSARTWLNSCNPWRSANSAAP